MNRWFRKLHRWGAIACALPLLLVILSGLLLQIKKQLTWVQPATQKGVAPDQLPQISFSKIVDVASQEPYRKAEIRDWKDIDRLDVRPGKGIVKVRSKNQWELQIDLESAEVIQCEYRRSDFIEALHDGSYFGDFSKLVVFLSNGLVLLGLWFTGIWLWYLPFQARRKKRKKQIAITNKT